MPYVMQYVVRRFLIVLGMLIVSACSTMQSGKSIQLSQPPASCLSDCSVVPEAGVSLSDWSFLVVQQYAECAIQRKQCSTALVNRSMK